MREPTKRAVVLKKKPPTLPLAASAYLDPLEREMAEFAAIARRSDLSVPVLFSKKWHLADLVQHLAGVHLWAAAIVRKGTRANTVPRRPADVDLASWYRQSADTLLAALRSCDPKARCWNHGPGPRLAEFWFRRQLHETMVHGRDADMALGDRREMPSLLAADGVDEVLTVWMPVAGRGTAKPPPRLSGPLLMHAVDTGHRWLLTPGDRPMPEAVAVTGNRSDAVARVSARAEDLLLMLWRRLPVTDPAIDITSADDTAAAFLSSRTAL